MRKSILIAVAAACLVAVSVPQARSDDQSSKAAAPAKFKSGTKAAKTIKPADPPSPPVPVVLPNPPTPVRQANDLGLTACAPMLAAMSRDTLTSSYDVQSGWHRTDPAGHVFQSVAGLNNPANTPPDSFAALIAAPAGTGGCDGVSVQILPLAGTCDTAQRVIETGGKAAGLLLNARIMLDGAGKRLILLPGFANTCIAISVESHFSPP